MKTIKITLSVMVGLAFGIWAFWKVDFTRMWASLQGAGYYYLIPMILLLFLSHWLRAWRWQILLTSTVKISVRNLFVALIIGYTANNIMPAHLGELVRAYVAGKQDDVSAALVFSSIVVERILDMLAFLIMAALAILLFPFPEWIIRGGYLILLFTGSLIVGLIFLKLKASWTNQLITRLLKPLPLKIREKLFGIIENFLAGLNGLENGWNYGLIFINSVFIWFAYGAIFWLGFRMFHFQIYQLNWLSAMVLLVITTIGVIVPNSPGYVGTYHKLCQLGLGLFGVPASAGISFAVILHAVNFIPVTLAGFIFMVMKGMSFAKLTNVAGE